MIFLQTKKTVYADRLGGDSELQELKRRTYEKVYAQKNPEGRQERGSNRFCGGRGPILLCLRKCPTLGGPMIMQVHLERVMSSSSSRPQEIVPSLFPFCPSSNSSSSRKFLGTSTKTKHIRSNDFMKGLLFCNLNHLLCLE